MTTARQYLTPAELGGVSSNPTYNENSDTNPLVSLIVSERTGFIVNSHGAYRFSLDTPNLYDGTNSVLTKIIDDEFNKYPTAIKAIKRDDGKIALYIAVSNTACPRWWMMFRYSTCKDQETSTFYLYVADTVTSTYNLVSTWPIAPQTHPGIIDMEESGDILIAWGMKNYIVEFSISSGTVNPVRDPFNFGFDQGLCLGAFYYQSDPESNAEIIMVTNIGDNIGLIIVLDYEDTSTINNLVVLDDIPCNSILDGTALIVGGSGATISRFSLITRDLFSSMLNYIYDFSTWYVGMGSLLIANDKLYAGTSISSIKYNYYYGYYRSDDKNNLIEVNLYSCSGDCLSCHDSDPESNAEIIMVTNIGDNIGLIIVLDYEDTSTINNLVVLDDIPCNSILDGTALIVGGSGATISRFSLITRDLFSSMLNYIYDFSTWYVGMGSLLIANDKLYAGTSISSIKYNYYYGYYRSDDKNNLIEVNLYSCSGDCLSCHDSDPDYCRFCYDGGIFNGMCQGINVCDNSIITVPEQECPAITSSYPVDGSTYGKTPVEVQVNTDVTTNTPIMCDWDTPSGSYSVSADSVTETSVTCLSPSSSIGVATLSVTADSNFLGSVSFEYYSCQSTFSVSGCPQCPNEEECGYCFEMGECVSEYECIDTDADTEFRGGNVGCPAIQSVSPTESHVNTTQNLVIVLDTVIPVNLASDNIECDFGSLGRAPATITDTTDNFVTIECLPTNIVHSYDEDSITLEIYTDGFKFSNYDVPTKISFYDCPLIPICLDCNEYPECVYCFDPHYQCFDVSDSLCGTESSICPQIRDATPDNDHINGNVEITLEAEGLDNIIDDGKTWYCTFKLGGVSDQTVATRNGNFFNCSTPTVIDSGTYSLSLFLDSDQSTDNYEFVYYNCVEFATCVECNRPIYQRCSFCIDDEHNSTLGKCLENEDSCSIYSTECISISSSDPASDDLLGGVSLTLIGEFDALSDVDVHCVFDIFGELIGSPANYISNSALTCTSVLSEHVGEYDLYLGLSISNGTDFFLLTDPIQFSYYDCGQFIECDSCIDPATKLPPCAWCVMGCVSSFSETCSLNNGNLCPVLNSVSPEVTQAGAIFQLLIESNNFDDSPASYRCDFLDTTGEYVAGAPAIRESINTASCFVPQNLGTGNYELLISAYDNRISDIEYKHYTDDTLDLTIVYCEETLPCDVCVDTQFCGYCPETGKCQVQGTCADSLLEECPRYDFNFLASDLTGTYPVTLTTSIDQELFVEQKNNLTCVWVPLLGSEEFKTVGSVSEDGKQISCETPAASEEMTARISIYYKDSIMIYESSPSQIFTFLNCSSRSNCEILEGDENPACRTNSLCGWCLFETECTLNRNCIPTETSNETLWVSGDCPSVAELSPMRTHKSGGETIVVSGKYFIDHPDIKVVVVTNGVETVVDDTNYNSASEITFVAPEQSVGDSSVYIYLDDKRYIEDSLNLEFLDDDAIVGNSLPPGGIAGIIIAVLLILILLIVAIVYLSKRRDKNVFAMDIEEQNYLGILFEPDMEPKYIFPDDEFMLWDEILLGSGGFDNDRGLFLYLTQFLDATDADRVARSIVILSLYHNCALEIITEVINLEIEGCNAPNTIFRGNSLASKMFKTYSRAIAGPYLFHTLASKIGTIAKVNEIAGNAQATELDMLAIDLELDGTKGDFTSDLDWDTNALQLQLTCQKILVNGIYKSLDDLPPELSTIFFKIKQKLEDEELGDEETTYFAVGGLFFLRFVIPSIFAPHVYGLLREPPSPETQRQLVLIAKVIQTIANLQLPGKKEEYMMCMHDFIEKHLDTVTEFYEILMNNPVQDRSDPVEVPDIVKANVLGTLYTTFYPKREKILEQMKEDGIKTKRLRALFKECGKVEKAN
eukprot:TRINITY_DN7576_c0_g1_i1.p1 TRINITY_DN7576_c0_g1~~TRINITY_DN7576_c0_g1_i1.p1  ORF type:complete len:1975 (-),score=432.40 TRINITY_DN7576_c0_g1_i1:53-5698(-)